jgi:hypothetical protein
MKPPVSIPKPCPKNWNELHGDSKIRFCEHCQQSVHNLSELNQKERNTLLSNRQQTPCVAFETDIKGRFIAHKDSSLLLGSIRRLRIALVSIVASIIPFAFSSCATRQVLGKPAPSADYKQIKSEECDRKESVTMGVPFQEERPLWKRILWPFN